MFYVKIVFVVILSYAHMIECIYFHLPWNRIKCIREQSRPNDLITGDYEVTSFLGVKVDLIVTDSKRNILAKQEDIKKPGKFTFTTETDEEFEICFRSKLQYSASRSTSPMPPHEIYLSLRKAEEAKRLDNLAEASILKPMEAELKKMEFIASAIVEELAFMRHREKQMRDTNESTSKRVTFLNIASLVILIGLAGWQVYYLRRYFKSKKLLD